MTNAIDALTLYQVGIEGAGTPGTLVPATAKLAVERVDFDEEGAVNRPRIAKGLLSRNRGSEIVTKRQTVFTIPDTPVVYAQEQLWLAALMGVDTPSAGPPYTWSYPWVLTAPPALSTLTLERRLSDGTNFVDHEFGYAFLNTKTWRYVEGDKLHWNAKGFARRQQASTLTAALALPALEFLPSSLAKVWIDEVWANLGTTQITGAVVGFELTFNNGAMPQLTADGRTDLDFSKFIINPDEISLSLKLSLQMSTARYVTEKAAAVAQTLRAIRIKVEGTGGQSITFDGLYKYTKPDLLSVPIESGQNMVAMELEESPDGTNMFKVDLINLTDQPDGV